MPSRARLVIWIIWETGKPTAWRWMKPGVGDVFGGGVAAVDGDGGVEVLGLGEEGVVLLPAY